jgi:hypothetical protein
MEGLGVKLLVFGENLKGEKRKMLKPAKGDAASYPLFTFPPSIPTAS